MVSQANKIGGSDDTLCSEKIEEELCNILSEIPGFNPKEAGNVKKTVRKFLLKYHPDKAKPTERKELVNAVGQIMDNYRACETVAQNENRLICDKFKKNKSKKEKSKEKETKNDDSDLKPNKKTAQCVRNVANWSVSKPYHKFDSKKFDLKETAKDIETVSPKLQKLLENIQILDAKDKKKGKQFKHFIYSDIKLSGHGPKVIASGLATIGKKCCLKLNKKKKLDFSIPKENKGETFGILCSSTLFGDNLTVKKRKEMLASFNKRPDNINGDNIRFIILDSGFKEGIDLFDVKYVHIFEPQLTKADMTQAVGRATRFCGQKGLKFVPNEGWKLDVFTYTSNTSQHTIEEIHAKYSGLNLSEVALREQLEKIAIDSAVDRDLNEHIHSHKKKQKEEQSNLKRLMGFSHKTPLLQIKDSPKMNLITGGATRNGCDKFSCNIRNIGKRKNKEFPYTLQYLSDVYDKLTKTEDLPDLPPKISTSRKRKFFCDLAKNNKNYCKMLLFGTKLENRRRNFTCDLNNNPFSKKECGKRSNNSVPFTIKEMEKAYKIYGGILPSGYKYLSPSGKRYFMCEKMGKELKFCNLLKATVRSNKTTLLNRLNNATNNALVKKDSLTNSPKDSSTNSPKDSSTNSPKEENILVPFSNKPNFFNKPNFDEDFDQFRKRINREFDRFKYDKMTIENLCNVPQSSDRIVKFTPSQDFISHYFVPKNNIKGLLVWHSVGTGKTCTAVATKSLTWEKQDYTILWVTRTTLRADIWKNMFEKVCDIMIREKLEKGIKIPEGKTGRKHVAKNFFNPVSFSQFSNAANAIFGGKVGTAKGSLYSKLVERNGKKDPFKKTLIIIDEAHKLLAKDLVGPEKPNFLAIQKAIANSYKKSGKDSCRPLLMTATPIMSDPMDFIRLLNLINEKQIPVNINDFLEEFPLDSKLNFKPKAIKKFQSMMKGKISYLNRSWDPRQFTQPNFHNIVTNISDESIEGTINYFDGINKCNKKSVNQQILNRHNVSKAEKIENDIDELRRTIWEADENMKTELSQAVRGTKANIKKKYTLRKKNIKENIKNRKKTLKKLVTQNLNLDKKLKTQKNKCIKNVEKERIKSLEMTQKYTLTKKCKLPKTLL